MKRQHLLAGFLLCMLSSSAWSQGHHEAKGEATVKIKQRSIEIKSEGREIQEKWTTTREYEQQGCAATLDLEYYQKGPHGHVKSTLKNEQCASSSGSYVLRIRYLPDEGEMDVVEIEETWSRDDDADIVTEKDYYVGEDLEIRRIKSASLKCECTEPQSGVPSSAGEPPRDKDRE